MQDRPPFAGVDHISPEHGLDRRRYAGLAGEADQQVPGLVHEKILRVVEEQVAGFQ